MKKLTTLFATIAMAATLAGGCGRKKNDTSSSGTTGTSAPGTSGTGTTGTGTTGTGTTGTGTTGTGTTGTGTTGDTAGATGTSGTTTGQKATEGADFPAECSEYRATVDRLADCQKLSAETRQNLKNAFQQSWTTWEKTPDKKTIVDACKAGTQTVRAAAATTCGW